VETAALPELVVAAAAWGMVIREALEVVEQEAKLGYGVGKCQEWYAVAH
tara:strand:- start:339 stop:485 length:147 start_codon:yes stop_codon:yes gene_type:complete